MAISGVPYNMYMWAALAVSGVYLPEPALATWWHKFTLAFHDVCADGPGAFLFVIEPLLILFSALIAQEICKLRPRTKYSALGLLLGAYLCFWLQPVAYGFATGHEWSPVPGYATTMPLFMGVGQLLLARRAYASGWCGAFRLALLMLTANYSLFILAVLLIPGIRID